MAGQVLRLLQQVQVQVQGSELLAQGERARATRPRRFRLVQPEKREALRAEPPLRALVYRQRPAVDRPRAALTHRGCRGVRLSVRLVEPTVLKALAAQ